MNPVKSAIICALLVAGPIGYGDPESSVDTSARYSLHIRGGTVVDGTGKAPFRADVLIDGDEIVHVGPVDESRITADEVIDATGKVVTPGFIDTHAHGDPLVSGLQESFVLQGVTTKVAGQDGRTPGFSTNNTVSLEQWRESMQSPDIDAAYPRSLLEWTHKVERAGIAPNIATLVGLGSLRWMSGVGTEPVPTQDQLDTMIDIIEAEMDAGAYGSSSGLEYIPGRYSRTDELVALAKAVGAKDGVTMSHMRTEDSGKILAAIDELIAQGEYARVHAAHMKIVSGRSRQEATDVVARMAEARATGVDITGDVYPYLAGMADLWLVYPTWAKQRSEFEDAVENDRPRLAQALLERVTERGGPERILITSGKFKGKNLAEVADELSLSFVDVLIDVFDFGGPGAAHFTQHAVAHDVFVLADNIAISTDGSPSMSHPRSYGSFPKVIEEYVVNDPRMSLEKAIFKMSGLPARVTGIRDRGSIAKGMQADLLVFAPENIRARATWMAPKTPPDGFDVVIVNGRIAVRDGVLSDKPYGRILRKGVN